MLRELIDKIPDEEAVLCLINNFNKLIHKYANLAKIEDSYEELIVFFIELIDNIKNKGLCLESDGQIVNYINISLKNKAIQLAKSGYNYNFINMSELSDEQLIYIDQTLSTKDQPHISTYFTQSLSVRERQILVLAYEQGYSMAEIARKFGISRQAVNQAKKRALEKIKKAYK